MKRKNYVIIILTVILCLAVFSSCNKTGGDNSDNNDGDKTVITSGSERFEITVSDGWEHLQIEGNDTIMINYEDAGTLVIDAYHQDNGGFDTVDEFTAAYWTFPDKQEFLSGTDINSYETVAVASFKDARKYQITTANDEYTIVTEYIFLKAPNSYYVFQCGYFQENYDRAKEETDKILKTFKVIR